ncbi:hypothetical protein GEMRC1_009373 [Eukaryota sp. GEM-RC1]
MGLIRTGPGASISYFTLHLNAASLIRSNDSQMYLENISVIGSLPDSPFILDKSHMELSFSNFSNIESLSFFQLTKSNVIVSHSSCSYSYFWYALFDLEESRITQNGFAFESGSAAIVFSIKSSVFDLNDFTIPSSISFNQLLSADNSDITLVDFDLYGFHSFHSVIFVSEFQA